MKFLLYLIRWQASTPILAFAMVVLDDFGTYWATFIANLVGACIFFFIDKWIFNRKEINTYKVKLVEYKGKVK